jgi:uncharacterized protein YuzE
MSLTSDLNLETSTYKYKIELLYVNTQTGESTTLLPVCIKSVCIDKAYSSNSNMPQIYVSASLDQKLIKDMVDNSSDNLINMTVYKFNDSADVELDEIYFQEQFIYMINADSGNIDTEMQYSGENADREDLFKDIQIGLLQLNAVNNNKKTISTVLTDTTMTNAIYTATSHMNVLLEPLLYDTNLSQLIIPPTDSVAEILKYLDNNRVFYNTPYRYFVDYDTTYILSSSGVATEKSDDIHDRVVIDIGKTSLDVNSNIVGLAEKNNGYYMFVSFQDSQIQKDNVTEKKFNQIDTVDTEGSKTTSSLENINKSSYTSNSKSQSVRVRQNNPNAVKNLAASIEHSAVQISLNKNDVDVSVLNPNLQYIVYNASQLDTNGIYILTRKRELFIKEGTDLFMVNVMMDLSRVDPEKLIESSREDADKNSIVIDRLFGNSELDLDSLL